MDFNAFSRCELQALCKCNGVRANMTNAAMAEVLRPERNCGRKGTSDVDSSAPLLGMKDSTTFGVLFKVETVVPVIEKGEANKNDPTEGDDFSGDLLPEFDDISTLRDAETESDSTLPELNVFESIQEDEKLNSRSEEVGVKETQRQHLLQDLHGMKLRKLRATYKELLSKEVFKDKQNIISFSVVVAKSCSSPLLKQAAEGKRPLPAEVDHNVRIIS
ncbi:hypothetical protein BS78_10G223900 [Paspalum vaginatum]|nr:hypothetical protein BS78_10G223900 [Paspalum vaginatum]